MTGTGTDVTITGNVGWSVMLSVALYAEDGKTTRVTDGSYGFGRIHATWGGRCVQVPASAFWPWAAGLVGMTLVGDLPPTMCGTFLDFDQAETWHGGVTYGLEVTGGTPWNQSRDDADRRRVTLSLGDFWDALTTLAEQQAGGALGGTGDEIQGAERRERVAVVHCVNRRRQSDRCT